MTAFHLLFYWEWPQHWHKKKHKLISCHIHTFISGSLITTNHSLLHCLKWSTLLRLRCLSPYSFDRSDQQFLEKLHVSKVFIYQKLWSIILSNRSCFSIYLKIKINMSTFCFTIYFWINGSSPVTNYKILLHIYWILTQILNNSNSHLINTLNAHLFWFILGFFLLTNVF